jgi:ribosomal protein S12 methylthiotransferase accessory factor
MAMRDDAFNLRGARRVAPEPWRFRSTLKIGSSVRCVTAEETAARVTPFMKKVPIARVADITPLDTMGLPVYSACTPLARDLTLHLGKGANAMNARVSAIMEAFERVSAEQPPEDGVVRATFRELAERGGPPPVTPEAFSLPHETTYAADRPFDWMPAYDLLTNEEVYMPVDLVINPPRERILTDVDTNGLASGNVLLEAVVHGICEVLERDVFSQMQFIRFFGDAQDTRPELRPLDLDTLPAEASEWVACAREQGFQFLILDTGRLATIPTYVAYLIDHHFPTPAGIRFAPFWGLGAHLSPRVALMRSITEAIQCRVGIIQGGRDSYHWLPAPRTASAWSHLRFFDYSRAIPFQDAPESRDLLDDLESLLSIMRRAGVEHCVVADLTRRDFGGVPVVRVRIPEMSICFFNLHRMDGHCMRWLL